MNDYLSFLSEADAAKMRLAQSFQPEELGRANHWSTAIATHDTTRMARTGAKQNSKCFTKIVSSTGLLTRAQEERHRPQRASQPYGLKRLYPKTRNLYVLQALNQLFEDYGLKQFCVEHPRLEREQVA